MRIVLKLTVAFLIVSAVVLTIAGVLRVRREVDLLESDMIQDHREMGRILAATVGEQWRSGGEDSARDLLQRAYPTGPVKLRWVWLDAVEGPDAPAGKLPEPSSLAPGADVVTKTHDSLLTWVEVPVPSGRRGAVEIAEDLGAERRYIRTTELHTVLTTIVTVAFVTGLAMILGSWIVGRPIEELVKKARRVGLGERSAPIMTRANDEIGELVFEMNAMSDRLFDAQDRIAKETADRLATLEQLRHADRLMTVGKLASGIAHELGTPLNVITLSARMIASGEVTGAEVTDAATRIAAQGDRMAAIIRQLLDFARRRPAVRTGTDLEPLVRRTLAMLEPLAAKRGVVLRFEGTETLSASVDPSQIGQAITNLVINAIQSMRSDGTVRVILARERARAPASDEETECLAIHVCDEGEGIAPDVLAHVFEPFFTTKDVGQGTGLGLSVSHGIVSEHQGWIAVESELGKGSRFTIFMPCGT